MSWVEDPGVDEFDGLNMTAKGLTMDEAYMKLLDNDGSYSLYYLSEDCYKCPYTFKGPTKDDANLYKLDVTHNVFYKLYKDTKDTYMEASDETYKCFTNESFGEFGVYYLNTTDCDLRVAKEPVNIYLPILIIFFILLGIFILTQAFHIIRKKYFRSNGSSIQEKTPAKRRVKALDTFRGMSIILMIFVNDGAGGYWWIEHATWNGLTIGDLVFPCFLWIMGVCIPISVKSLTSKGVPKYLSIFHIFKRSCKLFLIGLALGTQWGGYLENMRIFGVLQRFGISYFFVGSLVVLLSSKWKGESDNKFVAMFQDIIKLGWHWLIMLCLIALHLILTFCLPVPGCPTGYLGPGGKQDWPDHHENCIGGATKYIDVQVLGNQHLYQNPTAKAVYESGAFDPEGIFGCILSLVHVFFGVQAGTTLLYHQEWKQLISRWLCWGIITGIIGGVLCGFSQEDGVIPVNKNMWSLSFLLVTSCFAFILLSICYILIDVLKVWNGSPFIQPGMNSIVLYIGHSMCHNIFPFHWRFEGMRTHFVFLMEATWGTILWVLVAFELARKKIFFVI